MGRLIDANLVLGRLKNNIILGATELAFLRNYVNCCPTVDAVEVVRCLDCKHYEMGVCLKIYDDGAASRYAWQERKPDDFCSYGERKDSGKL